MLLSLDNVSKSFGTDLIFEHVNVTVHEADRIGFVGANGAGKTTLLNILSKQALPDEGNVIYKSGLVVGYLKQNSGLAGGSTILREMRSVFQDVLDARSKLEALAEQIAEEPNNAEALRDYAAAETFFTVRDGYNIDVNIKKVLNGMGFSDVQYSMVIDGLSGGEKTRLALAKLLLQKPDVLILDEPTNHLDFATLAWLENYLMEYRGAMLVVSHDRYFLDKVSTKIWELDDAALSEYRGNYSAFKVQKEEKTEYQLKEYNKQQNKIESMEDYARRNIARASTSKMAKSRLAQLSHIEVMKKPKTKVPAPSFHFEFDKRPVNDVLVVEDMALRVGEEQKLIVQDVSFEVKRDEHVAILGANGTGKSTLLKSILGQLEQKGKVLWGKNTQIGYYDQENKDMKPQSTTVEELWGRFPSMPEQSVRTMLGRVLITGEEVYKQVKSLSGGERAKLGLAILMAGRYNVMVLDEPTNHLDLPAREALEQALKEYEGTLLFVSHDRYFVNALSTKIIEIEKNTITEYEGNFDSYTEQKAKRVLLAVPDVSAQEVVKKSDNRKDLRRQQAEQRQRIGELEKRIAELETEEQELTQTIAENPSDFEMLAAACERLEQVKQEHELVMEEWLELV